MIMWNTFFNETSWTSYDKLIILLASEDFWRSSRPTTWRQNAFLVLCSLQYSAIHRGGPDVCDSQATTCSSAFLGGSFCDLRVHKNPWTSIVIYGNPCEFVETYGSWYAVAVIFVVLPAFAHPLDLLQHLFHWHFPWPRKTSLKTASQKAMERDELPGWAASRGTALLFFVFFLRLGTTRSEETTTSRTQLEKGQSCFQSLPRLWIPFLLANRPGPRYPYLHETKKQHPLATTTACILYCSLPLWSSILQWCKKEQMRMVYVYIYILYKYVCVFNKARKGWSASGRTLFARRKQWIWCL